MSKPADESQLRIGDMKQEAVDRNIAENVMGWSFVVTSPGGVRWYANDEGDRFGVGSFSSVRNTQLLWSPSIRLDDALQALFTCEGSGIEKNYDGSYRAWIWSKLPASPEGIASTPQSAICKALLQVKR